MPFFGAHFGSSGPRCIVVRALFGPVRSRFRCFRLRAACVTFSEKLLKAMNGVSLGGLDRFTGTVDEGPPALRIARQTSQQVTKQRRVGLADERPQVFARMFGAFIFFSQAQPDKYGMHSVVER